VRRLRRAAGLLLIALLPSCRAHGSEIAEAWASWRQAGVPAYVFDYEQSCFCFLETYNPVRIEVRGGRVARITPLDSAQRSAGSVP
jgi:hypothetical protein